MWTIFSVAAVTISLAGTSAWISQPTHNRISSLPACGPSNEDFENAGFSFRRLSEQESVPSRPNKSDLYSSEELQSLLNIHQNLQNQDVFVTSNASADTGEDSFMSLHDLVLSSLEEKETEGLSEMNKYPIDDALHNKLLNIRAIASDVDGTLLSSSHELHPKTKDAIKKAVEAAFSPVHTLQYFFPATGKSREGALTSLGPEIGALLRQVPGVFIQGLYCVDSSGKVVWEKKLSKDEIAAMERLSNEADISLFAYDGDQLFANDKARESHIREVHERWGEPLPMRLKSLASYPPGFHKCLVMDDDPNRINLEMRPKIEALADELNCTVTQAIPNMLEFLPSGCSKAFGVMKLCEHLGIDPGRQLLAVGDAENDITMLEMASVGIAMGNAVPKVREAADIILEETNDEGGAGIAIEHFGLRFSLPN